MTKKKIKTKICYHAIKQGITKNYYEFYFSFSDEKTMTGLIRNMNNNKWSFMLNSKVFPTKFEYIEEASYDTIQIALMELKKQKEQHIKELESNKQHKKQLQKFQQKFTELNKSLIPN